MMGLSAHDGRYRPSAGGVGIGEGNAAKGGTGSDADDGRCALGRLAQGVLCAAAACGAVGAAGSGRHRAIDDQHIFAEVVFHRLVARRFRGLACRRHEGVVIVQRDNIEYQVLDGGREGAGQRLEAAGAFLKRQVDAPRVCGALRNCSAIAGPIHGGNAMAEAVAVQNLMKLRRLMPCLRSISPTVSSFIAVTALFSPRHASHAVAMICARRSVRRRGDLIGCAGKNLRHPGHFEQFRNQFALRIAMRRPTRLPEMQVSRMVDTSSAFTVACTSPSPSTRCSSARSCGLIGRLRRSIAARLARGQPLEQGRPVP